MLNSDLSVSKKKKTMTKQNNKQEILDENEKIRQELKREKEKVAKMENAKTGVTLEQLD